MPTKMPLAHGMKFGRDVLSARPKVAVAMMNVVTLCSEIDYRWAIVLAEILEAEAAAGVAMYNAVDNPAAKGKLLIAAAAKRLSDPFQARLKKLMRQSINARALRNDVAHGTWGGIDGDLTAVILGDGTWTSTVLAAEYAVRHGVETLLGSAQSLPDVTRYELSDFEDEARSLAGIIDQQRTLTADFRAYRAGMRKLASHALFESLKRSQSDIDGKDV